MEGTSHLGPIVPSTHGRQPAGASVTGVSPGSMRSGLAEPDVRPRLPRPGPWGCSLPRSPGRERPSRSSSGCPGGGHCHPGTCGSGRRGVCWLLNFMRFLGPRNPGVFSPKFIRLVKFLPPRLPPVVPSPPAPGYARRHGWGHTETPLGAHPGAPRCTRICSAGEDGPRLPTTLLPAADSLLNVPAGRMSRAERLWVWAGPRCHGAVPGGMDIYGT